MTAGLFPKRNLFFSRSTYNNPRERHVASSHACPSTDHTGQGWGPVLGDPPLVDRGSFPKSEGLDKGGEETCGPQGSPDSGDLAPVMAHPAVAVLGPPPCGRGPEGGGLSLSRPRRCRFRSQPSLACCKGDGWSPAQTTAGICEIMWELRPRGAPTWCCRPLSQIRPAGCGVRDRASGASPGIHAVRPLPAPAEPRRGGGGV